jgi:hypothetical protein
LFYYGSSSVESWKAKELFHCKHVYITNKFANEMALLLLKKHQSPATMDFGMDKWKFSPLRCTWMVAVALGWHGHGGKLTMFSPMCRDILISNAPAINSILKCPNGNRTEYKEQTQTRQKIKSQ